MNATDPHLVDMTSTTLPLIDKMSKYIYHPIHLSSHIQDIFRMVAFV